LNQITGRLDSRFILTLFFPSLLFWGGLTAVYFAPTGLETALAQWRTENTDIQIMQIILALAWVTFFAYLLSNQLVWLTKQFEGIGIGSLCWAVAWQIGAGNIISKS